MRWPRAGHEVLTVRARTGDYWKVENLDAFTGYGWAQSAPGQVEGQSPDLPQPKPSALARWTQARDAVWHHWDSAETAAALSGEGIANLIVQSQAPDRATYLKRLKKAAKPR